MIGIEAALQTNNQHLFDLLVLPPGIDKDDVEDNIMLQGSEFEVVYSEPSLFRSAICVWGRKYYHTFDKWINALNLEYNPLENYDRIEAWGDHKERGADNTRTFNNQDKETLDTENKRTLDTEDEETRNTSDETTYDKTTTTTDDVSAFDSSSYQPSTKETLEEDGTVTIAGTGTDTFAHTGTDTMNNTGTDTMEHTGTIKDETGEEETTTHNGHVHGNIGVTTSQQMLQSELDIARFNIVQQITDLFLQEFCIMIYD